MPASAAVERARLPGGERAVLVDRRDLVLEAVPRRGEGWISFCRRILGTTSGCRESVSPRGTGRDLLAGVRYRFPVEKVTPELRRAAIEALFPRDQGSAKGWLHRSRGEDLPRVALWFTGDDARAPAIAAANGRRGTRLAPGEAVTVPDSLLRPEFRTAALPPAGAAAAAAPTAAATPEAAPPPPAGAPAAEPTATVELLAEPPAGPAPEGARAAPDAGQVVIVAGSEGRPPALVSAPGPPAEPPTSGSPPAASPPAGGQAPAPTSGAAAPAADAPPGAPAAGAPATPSGDSGPPPRLEYGEDAGGRFATYRLRGGEALYSAVVVRFTGRLHAEDVNALAAEIARRSGIPDVTDIPIGFPVRIPLDVLLPEFLPPGDPRRLEWEVERALSDRYRNPVQARGLEGVTVILDAGHGGADVGASAAGVWESTYVYDIMLRVRRRLAGTTLARVTTTTRDGERYVIVDSDVLPYSRGHAVLTTPPYPIADSTVGVHLRWYLANSEFRAATRAADPARVVFVSLHADSLHPSLRGATAYVPDVAGTAGTFGKAGSAFQKRREYRDQPRVSFSLETRQKSEGLSRQLAGRIIDAFKDRGLAVHPFQPVRDRIFRGRRAWVPAVLRYNAVPAKVLVEVCNLGSELDRRLLKTRTFREQVAEAVVAGIRAYFGETGKPAAAAEARR